MCGVIAFELAASNRHLVSLNHRGKDTKKSQKYGSNFSFTNIRTPCNLSRPFSYLAQAFKAIYASLTIMYCHQSIITNQVKSRISE